MRTYFQNGLIELVDWDVLIILDACRFDVFSMILPKTKLKGILQLAHSMSEHTEAWYKNYWNEMHDDIILISANPHSKVTGVHKNFFRAVEIGDDVDWVRPEPSLDVLLDLQKEYDKRFLVHLIPPHLPYIGKKGKEFIKELKLKGDNTMSIYRAVEAYGRQNGFKRPIECYEESLLETLKIIEKYIPKIKGKIVITSDHGEFLGEFGKYDHNYNHKIMFYVPWFEVEN